MSTGLARRSPPTGILPSAVEDVIVNGDLSKLSSEQRLAYYKARCEAAEIDPRCRPFQFISLQGKLVLYATKECAEQLNGKHGISHTIIESKVDEKSGLCEVLVQASMGGRTTVDIGIVPVAGLKGADLANAKMKAMTKAKRRATLSLCGLGDVVDESELDTISDKRECTETGQLEPPKNESGFGRGQYASEADSQKYLERMKAYLERRYQEFLDFWSLRCNGELPQCIPGYELCRIFQLDNHLVKWAVETGRLDARSMPADGIRPAQVGRYTAIVYHRSKEDQGAITREARAYLDKLVVNLNEKVLREHPELKNEGDLEEEAQDVDALDELTQEEDV